MRRDDRAAELQDDQAAIADRGIKGLIPIDRPFLDYVLTAVADAGYRQVCLVTAPDHHELRRRYAGLSGRRLAFEFAIQRLPRGTADALACAADFAREDAIAVINSDNFYPSSALESLRRLDGNGLVAFSPDALARHGNIEADRAKRFAMVQSDSEGFLRRIIEKPSPVEIASLGDAPLVSMNCWRFEPPIFQACRSIAPSSRGEYEIADAVIHSMSHLMQRYRVVPSHEAVLDLSFRRDIASVTQMLGKMEVSL
jgi:glucose-1-phosphate thymidylyltransferase